MDYTVHKLAQLSGVSIRTLRYYDKIGLLKPAYVAENSYRYYQEKELLQLQQILFFRELGFELKQIGQIIKQSNFDTSKTLQEHKKILRAHIKRLQTLIKTIDKTVDHLEGKQAIKETEIYYGFSKEKQIEYEQYLVKKLGAERKEFIETKERLQGWDQADWKRSAQVFDELHAELAKAILLGLKPADAAVQALVKKHFEHISSFWTPNKKSYIGLGQMYVEHPDFNQMYASFHPNFNQVYATFHPDLAVFLAAAMKLFAERELK